MSIERRVVEFVGKHKVLSGVTGTLLALGGAYGAGQHETINSVLAGFDAKPKISASVDGGVPEPTATATATAIATATATATARSAASCIDVQLKPGESLSVGTDKIVSGDVFVDGVREFDDNPKTGLLVEVDRQTTVRAPFGASVICLGQNPAETEGRVILEMKAKGCEGGCDRVDVVKTTAILQGTQASSCIDIELKKGGSALAPKNSILAGDVKADGVVLFDNDPKTGLVLEIDKDGGVNIEAPFGADIHCAGPDQTIKDRIMGQVIEETKASGCDGGCDRVEVIKIKDAVARVINAVTRRTDVHLKRGETRHFTGAVVIEGDVSVNGKRLYDDDPKSGLIVRVDAGQEVDVQAPFGADVIGGIDQATADKIADEGKAQMKESGCENGCSSVDDLRVSAGGIVKAR